MFVVTRGIAHILRFLLHISIICRKSFMFWSFSSQNEIPNRRGWKPESVRKKTSATGASLYSTERTSPLLSITLFSLRASEGVVRETERS